MISQSNKSAGYESEVYTVLGGPCVQVYTILRLALAGLEDVRRKQGPGAGGSIADTRFPERMARQILEEIVGDRQASLTREEFNQMVRKKTCFYIVDNNHNSSNVHTYKLTTD